MKEREIKGKERVIREMGKGDKGGDRRMGDKRKGEGGRE